MSVLDGKPAYPNSRPDFQGASRATRNADGHLVVRAPYGGFPVVIKDEAPVQSVASSPYTQRDAYPPRDYSQIGPVLKG